MWTRDNINIWVIRKKKLARVENVNSNPCCLWIFHPDLFFFLFYPFLWRRQPIRAKLLLLLSPTFHLSSCRKSHVKITPSYHLIVLSKMSNTVPTVTLNNQPVTLKRLSAPHTSCYNLLQKHTDSKSKVFITHTVHSRFICHMRLWAVSTHRAHVGRYSTLV